MANDDPHQRAVQLMLEGAALEGDLPAPAGARGVVLFAHGSGSSRLTVIHLAVVSLDRWLGA